MTNRRQPSGIMTKSYRGEDRSILVQTTIKFQEGSSVVLESQWVPDRDEDPLKKKGTSVKVQDLTVLLPKAPTLLMHSDIVKKEFGLVDSENTDNIAHLLKSVKQVHLVTRQDGVEVFLDPLSAKFWGGPHAQIRKVSVYSAASALKTDRESVIESAQAASNRAWEAIDVVLAAITLGINLEKHLEDIGLSVEELSDRNA